MNQLLFNSIFIASAAVVWKNLQKDFPTLGKFIHSLPWLLMKAIHCSFCVIYWTSLFFILFETQGQKFALLQTVYHWFILGFISYFFYTTARVVHFTMEILYEKYTKMVQ